MIEHRFVLRVCAPQPHDSGWTKRPFVRRLLAAVLPGVMFAIGCGGDDSPANAGDAGGMCIAALPLNCQPAFPPTYDMIYGQLLSKTCGNPGTGGSCHSAVGKQGDLVLADIDGAYAALVTDKNKAGLTRVVPDRPECSILEERLESSDPALRMPLGNDALSEPLRCAVRKWIAMGAPRQ